MPNGRSGGFLISKDQLEQLLKGLGDQPVLGHALANRVDWPTSSPSWAEVDAAAARTMLSTFPGERVWVEEQDHTYYILHLDHEVQEHGEPEAGKWIVVRSESPLFGPLRECHRHGRE